MPDELDPIEVQLIQDFQTGQRHIAESIDKMIAARHRDQQRIVELEEQVAALVVRVAELVPE